MKLNVMHLIVKLPIGGMEKMLYEEVRSYNKDLFNPIVCCIKEGGFFAEKLREDGIKVHILNRMKTHSFDFWAVYEIYKILKKENIHILRTHAYHANLYGRIAGRLAKTPIIVCTYHNIYEQINKPKFHRRLFNFLLYNFCDSIVAVSNRVAKDIERIDKVPKEKIRVIYNGIEIEKFTTNLDKKEARYFFGLPEERIIVGTLGRLTTQKGVEYLVRALEGLDISLAIGGKGPLEDELKTLAKSLKIDSYFLGAIEPEKVPIFLSSLDIFCFPSLWEGMGVTLVEAMAVGLPIVASDLDPIKEVLGDCGIYFPKKDTSKLKEALIALVEDEHKRKTLSKKAKERAKIFSIKNTVAEYENLFLELYKKKYGKI